MAKITGPLMSLDASGSVASTITFSKWKGRNYVRQLVKPANPKSAAQTAFRAMFGFLSSIWKTMSPTDQGSWDTLAAMGNYSPFNAFTHFNQKLWTQVLTPTANSSYAQAGTPSAPTAFTATGGVRQITIDASLGASATQWGMIVYRNANTGFTPTQNDVVGILKAPPSDDTVFLDSGLAPGTYYYRIATFTTDGVASLYATEHSADAT